MEAHGAERSLRMKNNLGPLVPGSVSKKKKSYPLYTKEIGTLASIFFWVKCIIYSIYIDTTHPCPVPSTYVMVHTWYA